MKFQYFVIFIIISLCLLTGVVSAISGNGGFETGKSYPWDFTDTWGYTNRSDSFIIPVAAHTGNYGAIIITNVSTPPTDNVVLSQWYPTGYILDHNVTFWYKIANVSGSDNYINFYIRLDNYNVIYLVYNMSVTDTQDWTKFDMSLEDIITTIPDNSGWTMEQIAGMGGLTRLGFETSTGSSEFIVYIDDVDIPEESHQFNGGFESNNDISHWGDVWVHPYPYYEVEVSSNEAHSGDSSARFFNSLSTGGDYELIEIAQEIPVDWKYIDYWYKPVTLVPTSTNSYNKIDVSVIYGLAGTESDWVWLSLPTINMQQSEDWVHVNMSRADILEYMDYTEDDLLRTSRYVSLNIEVHGRNYWTDPVDFEVYIDDVSIDLDANFTNTSTGLDATFNDTSTGSPTGWAWFFGDENYTQRWVQQNGSVPWGASSDGSLVVLPNGHLIKSGGKDGGAWANDVWRSTDNGVTWQLMNSSSGWTPRNVHTSVALQDGNIVLMGGYDSGRKNDTWRSMDEGATWQLMNASSTWLARSGHTSVALPDGSIVLMGGGDNYNDTWRSTDEGATWVLQNESSGWAGRQFFSSVALPDGSVVLMGGSGDDPSYRNDTWRSTDKGVTWIEMNSSSGWDARTYFSSVAMADGSILVIGGYTEDGDTNSTWRSMDLGATWIQLPNANWSERSGLSSVALPDGSIITLGGWAENNVWRMQPVGSSLQNATHTYATTGLYNVTLQVYNALTYNLTQKQIIISSEPLVANFTNTSTDLSVTFTDTSTGSPAGWAWFFGDEPYNQSWVQQSANAGWTARKDACNVALPDGSVVIVGGANFAGVYIDEDDTWRSTDKGVTWQLQNASGPFGNIYDTGCTALSNGHIILVGGGGIGRGVFDDAWRSTDQGVTWQLMNSSIGWSGMHARRNTVALPDDSIVSIDETNVFRSTDEGYTWDIINTTRPATSVSSEGIIATPDGKIIITGGYDEVGGDFTCNNNTWLSTDKGYTWTLQNNSSGWYGRTEHIMVALPDNSILLQGGYFYSWNSETEEELQIDFNDTWRSENYGATWTQLINSAYNNLFEREYPGIVTLSDGSILLLGGKNLTSYYFNDTWRFDPAGSHLQNPSHTYASDGMYNVTLQVYNALTYNSTQKQITVPSELPLVANFTNTSTDLSVTFTDISTGSPTGWAWFFGDENYTQSWVLQNASGGWSTRDTFSVVSLPDGSIVLTGGFDLDSWQPMNDTWRSTDQGVTWQLQNASSGWKSRNSHASVALSDSSIVLMGGSTETNDTWMSTDKGVTWTRINNSSGWLAREYHSVVALPDDNIVLMGGSWTDWGFANDTWRSTDYGVTWTLQNASSGWVQRYQQASVALSDGSIVLLGGCDYDGYFYNDTWKSTDNGATWTLQNVSSGWVSRSGHAAAAMPDGSIVLMGGNDGTRSLNDTWRSTDQGKTWVLLNASSGWSARPDYGNLPSAVLSDGSIIITGADEAYVNDTWRLDPAGSHLQNPPHTYVSDGMYNVTLQVYNAFTFNKTQKQITVPSELPLVANFTNTSIELTALFNDTSTGSPTGWAWFFGDELYNQSWVQQSANAGWDGRLDQDCVVLQNGSIILVGGNGISGYQNDTWISTNKGVTWVELSSPLIRDGGNNLIGGGSGFIARGGPTIVSLLNDDIVLMGGEASINYQWTRLNDTWRSTDEGVTWQLQNMSSGWGGRKGHSSVAIPNGNIVLMGGYSDDYYFNDTWRSTDEGVTWQLMNGSSGWSGRIDLSSTLLTDNSIIITGGSDDSDYSKNDTWRSTDEGVTWQLQNASGGWMGGNMQSIVSMPDSSILLMGGQDYWNYIPTGDIWRSIDNGVTWSNITPISDYWAARYGHSSVLLPDGSIVLIGGYPYPSSAVNDTWRFDPAGSHLQNPSHTYSSPGMYNVTLQVYNAFTFNKTTKSLNVSESVSNESTFTPFANFTATSPTGYYIGNVLTGYMPFTVTFTDTSVNGTPTNWSWSFGDGVYSEQQNPVHIYTINNTYRVTLVASNVYGSSSYSRNITVTPILPLASFTVSPNVGTVPLTVSFTDTSLGVSIINWSWDFGDGSTSYLRNPVHSYVTNGTYYTRLSVTTLTGDYNISQLVPVYAVLDPVPMVDFIGSPLYGKSPLVVQFTDKSASLNGLIGWNWSFGDGDYTNSTAQNPLHVYQNPGQYSVTLVVLGQNNHFLSVPHGTTSEQIVNGGFETGDFTGWNGVGSDITDFDPYSGSYASYINWDTGIINQDDINFTGVHILTFWTNSSSDLSDMLTVNISGTTILSENISGSWQEHLVDVSSFSGNHSLTFTQTGSNFIFIDNVSALSINTSYTTSTPLTNYTSKHGYINVEISSGSVNADYTATPTIGDYPLTVQFTDTSVCNPVCTNWAWDFNNDGSVESVLQNPVYTYTYPGNYSPKLVASNSVNAGTKIRNLYITVGPIFTQPTIPQPTASWAPNYGYNGTRAYSGSTSIDVVNSTYLKYWLQNFTTTKNFSVYAFSTSIMAPLLHVFGFWIFLIIWGLYLFAVWIRSQDVTLPLVIGIISMGTFGLLFPKESLPVIIIMFVVCGAIIITKLMKDAI